jgi:hypothetical protein
VKKGVIPAKVRPANLQWGYDGEQSDPAHRVSVNLDGMLRDILSLSARARGVLLTIFIAYWRRPTPEPVELSYVQGALRLRGDVFREALGELVEDGCVKVAGKRVTPIGAFGASDEKPAERKARRDMPSDWLELREAVFARDGYSCVYCGSGADLHCDHVEPVALGGSHDINNLVTACAPCNLSKGSKTVAEWRPDIWMAMQR